MSEFVALLGGNNEAANATDNNSESTIQVEELIEIDSCVRTIEPIDAIVMPPEEALDPGVFEAVEDTDWAFELPSEAEDSTDWGIDTADVELPIYQGQFTVDDSAITENLQPSTRGTR